MEDKRYNKQYTKETCPYCNKEDGMVWITKTNGYGYQRVKCDHIGPNIKDQKLCVYCNAPLEEYKGELHCSNPYCETNKHSEIHSINKARFKYEELSQDDCEKDYERYEDE